ncbi:serine/threonine protein phosphatase [Tardiphaga alba]|uniref:Serine/threonine protein phosphatase n=1 Tax=Tardiphaga alba TaxID=340268 RepID=A0ABX8A8F4_9BRAD|nr:metallophosphoesterase [Tardiphaga alba]QUS39281.1 serine/threonine protein phosphatase [Tardiphaga alba]
MPLTYVIPDLHGRRDLLDLALARIVAHAMDAPATLVVLGDFVDKGPDSRGVIARLRTGLPASWRVVTLKGNHDALMVAALRGDIAITDWLEKGGDAALMSYGGDAADVPVHDVDWLDGRPLFHEDAHRVYVHAGVEPALPLRAQDVWTLLTKRYADDDDSGLGGKHVVHGHDRHPDGPLLLANRSNLDTNAWKTGRLAIGVFDDHVPGGPVEVITVTAPPAV